MTKPAAEDAAPATVAVVDANPLPLPTPVDPPDESLVVCGYPHLTREARVELARAGRRAAHGSGELTSEASRRGGKEDKAAATRAKDGTCWRDDRRGADYMSEYRGAGNLSDSCPEKPIKDKLFSFHLRIREHSSSSGPMCKQLGTYCCG